MLSALIIAATLTQPQQAASAPDTLATICDMPVPMPSALPPPDSGPVFLALGLCFAKQGGSSLIDPATYLHYIQARPSRPEQGAWAPYDESVRDTLLQDFRRLWATKFLDDAAVEVTDHRLPNGVIAKVAFFNLEERQRVRIVDFEGLNRLERGAIDERLRERNLNIALDAFLDAAALRQVASCVRELYGEKGHQFAEVKPVVKPIQGPGKQVHVTFHVSEGPRVVIRDITFIGNRAIRDDVLEKALKVNRAQGLLSFMNKTGVYQPTKYDEDADKVVAHYRDKGYLAVRVGQPELRPLGDSADGRVRYVQVRIPVSEGIQYRVGSITFAGNDRVNPAALAALFDVKAGQVYSDARIRKGLDKAREIYGAGGYYEFTAYPDLEPDEKTSQVAVRMRIQEGRQYFVNRITITGNTQTRDDVVRRELGLVEAGVFNTEALKYSIRRLNQLGYFKPLEGEDIEVEKTQGKDDRVDVTFKVEEQNRNQVSFGAGVSQYEGVFGNLSFTTSNFMGRGESLTLQAQKGSRSNTYGASFTRPYLFNRPIFGGVSLYSRKIDYQIYTSDVDYSEVRAGVAITGGLQLRRFTRLSTTYGYEVIDTAASDDLQTALSTGGGVQYFLDQGRYLQSTLTPTLVYNTVDNPITPRRGSRLTASYQAAGGLLGGTTRFAKPELEAVLYVPLTRRTAFGGRAQAGWLWNYGSQDLPYYLRYFMGGENQIRGTDIRSVGPMNENGAALGGSKFVLFNAEYYYDVASMVRALLFHDAGQAFDERHPIDLRQLRTSTGAEVRITLPVIGAPFRLIYAWNIYRDTSQPARTFRFAVGATF